MHTASEAKNIVAMKLLLDAGLFIGSKNKTAATALHLCVAHGFEEGVNELITRGADLSVKNKRGQTPADYGCFGEAR